VFSVEDPVRILRQQSTTIAVLPCAGDRVSRVGPSFFARTANSRADDEDRVVLISDQL
jgi:hypothetical protein